MISIVHVLDKFNYLYIFINPQKKKGLYPHIKEV